MLHKFILSPFIKKVTSSIANRFLKYILHILCLKNANKVICGIIGELQVLEISMIKVQI